MAAPSIAVTSNPITNLVPGQKYTVSVWAKVNSAWTGGASISFYDVSGPIGSDSLSIDPSILSTSWQNFVGVITCPNSLLTDIRLGIRMSKAALPIPPIYWDDLTITPAYAQKLVGPNEMDSLDGQAPVATIVDSNNGVSTKSTTLGTPQYNPGNAVLGFFKDSTKQTATTPQVGDLLHVKYRKAGAAMGRVRDTSNVSVEGTLWGDNGVRSIVRGDLSPLPHTSADCEAAAAAIVGDNSYQHYDGSYEQFSTYFTNEPLSGTILPFANLPTSFPTIQAEELSKVETTMMSSHPTELFDHVLTFGKPDVLQRFLTKFTQQTDAFAPQDTAEIPTWIQPSWIDTNPLEDVPALAFVSTSPTQVLCTTNQEVIYDNYLSYTEDFSTLWGSGGSVTVTANFAANPFSGSNTADKLVATATDSFILQSIFTPTISAILGKAITFSVWLRVPSGTSSVNLVLSDAVTNSSTTCSLTTSWKRFSVTKTINSNVTSIIAQLGGSNSFSTGAIIYAFGGQVNLGSSALLYVPNTATTLAVSSGFELRYSDEGWGADDGKNLIIRTTSRTFNVPRTFRGRTAFIKAYNGKNKLLHSELTTDWTTYSATLSQVSGVNPDGDISNICTAALTSGLGFSNGYQTGIAYVEGSTWTFSISVKGVAGNQIRLLISSNNSVIPVNTVFTLNGQWQRFSVSGTFTVGDGADTNVICFVRSVSPTTQSIQFTKAQLEQSSTETSYTKTMSTAYGQLSRYASAIRVNFPLVPPAPTATLDTVALALNSAVANITPVLPTVTQDVWGVEIRASDNATVVYHKDLIDPNYVNTVSLVNTVRSMSYYVYTYNLLGEYSTAYNLTNTIATPTITALSVDSATRTINWTTTGNPSYFVVAIDGTDNNMTHLLVNAQTSDKFYQMLDQDFFAQRWIFVSCYDSLGSGSNLAAISHIATPPIALASGGTNVFNEVFDQFSNSNPVNLGNGWNIRAGDTTGVNITATGTQGGNAFTSNKYVWLTYPYNIAFDPSKLYRMRVRINKSTNPSSSVAYCGVEGIAADGSTLVNYQGANNPGSQHYVCLSNTTSIPIDALWHEYTGFFKGSALFGYTDLVINGSVNTRVSSASYNFVSTDIGRFINVLSGTGFTVAAYQITSLTGTAANVGSAVGTVGSTGGHWEFCGDVNPAINVSNPAKLHNLVRYIRPLLILDYLSGTDQYAVDAISIDIVPDSIDQIPDGSAFGRVDNTALTTNFVDPSKGGVLKKGSLSPNWSGQMNYASDASSITWSWSSLTLYKADNTTVSIGTGSLVITGLSAVTTYYFYPYYNENTLALEWVVGGVGSSSAGAIAQIAPTSALAQTQGLAHHAVLSGGGIAGATTSGGGGTGFGGGDGSCLRTDMLVETRDKGIIPIEECVVGDWLRGRNGAWTEIVMHKILPQTSFVRVTLCTGDVVVVSPTHPFTLLDETSRQAQLLCLSDMLWIATGVSNIESIQGVNDPEGHKVSVTCEPEHEFYAGEILPNVLTHNMINPS